MATPSTALLDLAEKTLDRAVVLKDPTTAGLHTLRAIGYALVAIGRELHAGAIVVEMSDELPDEIPDELAGDVPAEEATP